MAKALFRDPTLAAEGGCFGSTGTRGDVAVAGGHGLIAFGALHNKEPVTGNLPRTPIILSNHKAEALILMVAAPRMSHCRGTLSAVKCPSWSAVTYCCPRPLTIF